MAVRVRLSWLTAAAFGLLAAGTSGARADVKSLTLYNTHTQERATIVFKRNGAYDPSGLAELNQILRDWRRNEATKMDPALFDLIWEVYRDSGASQPIHIICGYRSPSTNNMLRSRSRGVAKFSQHMLGKAMDFYLPDVPLDKLRAVGMKKQIGGVGFYPTSGSPFVHMDTGSVRAWPRMTREQLVRLFPDGKTLHLPADGGPLPRYQEALAEYQSKRGSSGSTAVAWGSDDQGRAAPVASGPTFLTRLFGGGQAAQPGDDEDDTPAPAKAQELRQGPTPPGSTSVASAASAVGDLPPPPPPAPRAQMASLAASPAQATAAALPTPQASTPTQATASLPAAPPPAPRAPGAILPATAGSVPPGWNAGPAGQPVQQAAAVPPALVPQPGKTVQASAAPDAIATLTGALPDAKPSALGYAPVPAPKPADPYAFGSNSVPKGAGVQVASLAPDRGFPASTTDIGRSLAGVPSAKPPLKGNRTDPLARIVGRNAPTPDGQFLDGNATTRTERFAVLQHPDQDSLPQLIVKPSLVVQSGFGGPGDLRADRFSGPAVVALVVTRTE